MYVNVHYATLLLYYMHAFNTDVQTRQLERAIGEWKKKRQLYYVLFAVGALKDVISEHVRVLGSIEKEEYVDSI